MNAVDKVSIDKIKRVREGLTEFFNTASSLFCTDEVVSEIMTYRGYQTQEMFETLKRFGVFKVSYLSDLTLLMPDIKTADMQDWGLLTDKGEFLLKDRYIFAIRDIAGQVIALVGWDKNGGPRKYVTSSTYGFSRDTSFFNLDCYKTSIEKYNGVIFVVEGIFDTVSISSLGLPVVGAMGLDMSKIKSYILTRFGKAIIINDNDAAGKSVSPLTNGVSGKKPSNVWCIENDKVFVTLPKGIKDIDIFIRDYDCYSDLLSCMKAKYVKRLKSD